ncbi:MAG: hypothetical protein JW811_01845 [Clostridiales bacterium]|nr:hypothetical protein [Clostridiales bacterium]
MRFRSKPRSVSAERARRKAVRKAAALPPDRQSLAAVYAMGIRDGLQIAADIRRRTKRFEGNAS